MARTTLVPLVAPRPTVVGMYRTALFDIDGTLCDPGSGITDAVRHALARLGIAEEDEAALRRFVGPPLEHSFRDYYALPPDQVERAVAHYREHYRDAGISLYRPYPGAAGLLSDLTASGVRVGVVTAKIQAFAEEALRSTGLLDLVGTVHGRAPDEVVTKQVTLHAALRDLAAPPATVVMVGDREHDVHAARDNGVDSIGVLHGFGTAAELTSAGATHLARDLDDVRRIVLRTPQ
ncbi:HAD hydrolase-like protein [Cellulomonas sp. 179-A 4D5 NHS]|uniref:HAD hydrolase-like protein n=1 Tax=Cellulomonas sp. 179-A 4D5 NHS TaxID=3142378 RepID=UPI0039A0F66D